MLSFLNTLEYPLDDLENPIVLFGTADSHLKLIENELGVSITTRGEVIRITGEEANIQSAKHIINALHQNVQKELRLALVMFH